MTSVEVFKTKGSFDGAVSGDESTSSKVLDAEYRGIRRKVDIHLLPYVSILYLLSYLWVHVQQGIDVVLWHFHKFKVIVTISVRHPSPQGYAMGLTWGIFRLFQGMRRLLAWSTTLIWRGSGIISYVIISLCMVGFNGLSIKRLQRSSLYEYVSIWESDYLKLHLVDTVFSRGSTFVSA